MQNWIRYKPTKSSDCQASAQKAYTNDWADLLYQSFTYGLVLLFSLLSLGCSSKPDKGAGQQNQTVTINEILAKNGQGLVDEDGDASDWIELYNPTSDEISLGGYALTDHPAALNQWKLPAVGIEAEGYLLIWASGKNRARGRSLHTNFKLDGDGETIYFVHPDGEIIDSLTFGPQRTDVSYGKHLSEEADWLCFLVPSPGQPNSHPGFVGMIDTPPICSLAEGDYPQPVTVAFKTPRRGSEIRYTLDGSTPTAEHGQKYYQPIRLGKTTVIRACTAQKGYLPSPPITRTYLIAHQHVLPVISIVTEPRNLWDGHEGIYANSTRSGRPWERPAAVTFFRPDRTDPITLDVGLRIHGGASRERSDKQSFRLYFRNQYGEPSLNADILPSVPHTSQFKRLVLRGAYNDSWCHRMADHDDVATYVRDQLARDLHLDMGQVGAHGDFVVLYLNGAYWGLYNLCERISGTFLSRYLGEGEWDIIKDDQAREGNSLAWERFKAWFPSVDLSLDENYRTMGQVIDIENFTDYFILNTWIHNYDWPHHNWYAARKRDEADARWIFLVWDAEYGFGGGRDPYRFDQNTIARVSQPEQGPLAFLFNRMLQNADYRAYFTARFEQHLAGVLNPKHVHMRLEKRLNEVRSEIEAEGKRWNPSKQIKNWEVAVTEVRGFINHRSTYVRRHLESMPTWLKYQSYPNWHRRYPERR